MWESSAPDIVACAGTQGGKTAVEAPWLLREIQRCAPLIKRMGGGKFLYAGPTLTLLAAQAIPAFRLLFEEDERLGRLVMSPKPIFNFSREGLYKTLGFADCPVSVHFAYTNDSSNLESMTALGAVWDEAGQKENRQASHEAMNRRLKVARSNGFGRRLWGTTPYEWHWFKYDVIDRIDGVTSVLLNWPSWMNPMVSEDECRIELEKGMPLWRWQMMYLGQFTRPAGLIYDTFDFNLDTCEAFTIPPDWKIYPGADFGNVNMAGGAVAEDPVTKTLYVIGEYLAGTNKSLVDHVKGIKASLSDYAPGHGFQVGAGGSHQEEGWRDGCRSLGLLLNEPPVNDVEVQIQCVYSQLATHSLKVFRTCRGVIDNLTMYSRELDDMNNPTEKIANKASYHHADWLRYIVTMLRPPKLKRKSTIQARSGAWY